MHSLQTKNNRVVSVVFCSFTLLEIPQCPSLRSIKAIECPLLRVVVDIFPNFAVIGLVANNVIVEGTLKKGLTALAVAVALEQRHELRKCCISTVCCRGRRLRRPVFNNDDQMYVVWHNYIFVNGNIFIEIRHFLNTVLNNFSVSCKNHFGWFKQAVFRTIGDDGPYGYVFRPFPFYRYLQEVYEQGNRA